ncbi:ABC transporter permease [Acrocarpospora pleiomorpha]|uniref:ABC transporter permease n=1 Tax=Acrocarpospora pleiomorpha TaxID=90975 RepID=A0A5M3XXB4_9ACTN|nr:ABC transporter permease [Acrocarpospora pleiomorpha]GES25777.1 ABC transporter permease [Acrocarpospora pleiomorpha]
MGVYILRRILIAVPTVLILMFMVFLLADLSPADPALTMAGGNATPEQVAEVRTSLGLDQPLPERYVDYVRSALHGDFGTSPISGLPVLDNLRERVPVTLSLVSLALLFAIGISVLLGTVAAIRKGTILDTLISSFASLLMSLPSFVSGLLLILLLAIYYPAFPATGSATPAEGLGPWLTYTTLPAIALALVPAALMTRQIRGALLDALEEDYVRTARAKGLTYVSVAGKHAAKNAAVPIVTILSLEVVYMIGNTVVVERLFALPGVGALGVDSVINGDLVTLQGMVLFVALIVLVVNLLADLSYGYLNPRLAKR